MPQTPNMDKEVSNPPGCSVFNCLARIDKFNAFSIFTACLILIVSGVAGISFAIAGEPESKEHLAESISFMKWEYIEACLAYHNANDILQKYSSDDKHSLPSNHEAAKRGARLLFVAATCGFGAAETNAVSPGDIAEEAKSFRSRFEKFNPEELKEASEYLIFLKSMETLRQENVAFNNKRQGLK